MVLPCCAGARCRQMLGHEATQLWASTKQFSGAARDALKAARKELLEACTPACVRPPPPHSSENSKFMGAAVGAVGGGRGITLDSRGAAAAAAAAPVTSGTATAVARNLRLATRRP